MSELLLHVRPNSELSQINFLPWKSELIQLAHHLNQNKSGFLHHNFFESYIEENFPIFCNQCNHIKPSIQIDYIRSKENFVMALDPFPLVHAGKIIITFNSRFVKECLIKILHILLHEFQHVFDKIHDLEITETNQNWFKYDQRWFSEESKTDYSRDVIVHHQGSYEALIKLPSENSAYLKSLLNSARFFPDYLLYHVDSLDTFIRTIGYNQKEHAMRTYLRSPKQIKQITGLLAKHGFVFRHIFSQLNEKDQKKHILRLCGLIHKQYLKEIH